MYYMLWHSDSIFAICRKFTTFVNFYIAESMKEDLSLVEQTQKRILNYIAVNSELKKLPKEQELVDILGVSRVVIREALSQLRALGLIETKKKKGTVVKSPDIFGTVKTIVASNLLDKPTLRDLYQLRIMLEIGMADFIYRNKTEEQMSRMDSLMQKQHEIENILVKTDSDHQKMELAEKLTEIDVKFHGLLFEMTGNQSLIDFQYILRHLFTLYFPAIKNDFRKQNVISHIGLYNLLRNGNPESFRTAMRLHLSTQIDNMEQNLDKVSSH